MDNKKEILDLLRELQAEMLLEIESQNYDKDNLIKYLDNLKKMEEKINKDKESLKTDDINELEKIRKKLNN